MQTIIQGAGAFIWPLGFCSLLAVYLIIERALALRVSRVAPEPVVKAVLAGQLDQVGAAEGESVAGRLVQRWKDGASGEVLKAWARHELIRLQRGLHLLDSIVAGAPLLGLLGTVAGLASLFPEQGLPDTQTLTRGVGLALSTTLIGLCIAIPALLAANWLSRRLEVLSSRLDVLVEALEARRRRADINVVPLIDVMVVLVFFLLLSGRFEQTRALAIVPPTASAGTAGAEASSLVVGVDRDGKLYLEGKAIAADALAKALVDRALKSPGTEVIIVADERSLTGAAVGALDAAAKAGLKPRLQTRQPR